jgi:uncharacterized protein YjbI with pentapeptide repeats
MMVKVAALALALVSECGVVWGANKNDVKQLKNQMNQKALQGQSVACSGFDLSGVNFNDAQYTQYGVIISDQGNSLELAYADFSGANLSGANLDRVNLAMGDLSQANLSKTSLRGARLADADLSEANLVGADLGKADLNRADLDGAYLNGANLSGATLRKADLRGTNLTGVDLTGANLTGANLTGVNLSGAKGVGSIQGRNVYHCMVTNKMGNSRYIQFVNGPIYDIAKGKTLLVYWFDANQFNVIDEQWNKVTSGTMKPGGAYTIIK